MKTVYVLCSNHMDPVWIRRWQGSVVYRGKVVRPYSDLETAQVEAGLQLSSRLPLKYGIEQTLTVREYLRRNGDRREQFARAVRDGRVELLGGGETVIDYNMVCGESLVRTHFYSIRYCRREFGVRPAVAFAPDTFGLSAQLPQVLRQLGYEHLADHSRVFDEKKPFWRGLDGSVVCILRPADVASRYSIGFGGHFPAECCGGEGCPACEHTGIDRRLVTPLDEFSVEDLCKRLAADAGTPCLMWSSEESRPSEKFFENLIQTAPQHGLELRFVTYAECLSELAADSLKQLRSGDMPAEGFVGVEGNPVCTGCYLSRIELKMLNRRMEGLLTSAEKFAAFAAAYGMTYPQLAMERLWNQTALFQFHDAITSSHCDDAYADLLDVARDVQQGAGLIYSEAMRTIERQVGVPGREGYSAALMFNPLNWQVRGDVFEAYLEADAPRPAAAQANVAPDKRTSPAIEPEGVELLTAEGQPLDVVEAQLIRDRTYRTYRVKFLGATLPSTGYATLYWRPTDAAPAQPQRREAVGEVAVENEFYRVVARADGVREVFDKTLGRNIAQEGFFDLAVEEDYGSPWETLVKPIHWLDLRYHADRRLFVESSPLRQALVVEGTYAPRFGEKGRFRVQSLVWRQEIVLHKGVATVDVRTELDADSENCRVHLRLPLAFRSENDKAAYEIPFGVLERPKYKGRFGEHTWPNGDWPTLNFVSVADAADGTRVNLFNRGLPCCRVSDGVILAGLLRSPQIPMYAFDFAGAKDAGRHVFRHRLTSHAGTLRQGRVVQRGMEFNTPMLCCPASPRKGQLRATHSFAGNASDSVIFAAVKRAEEGNDILVRAYETYGEAVQDQLSQLPFDEVIETNLLEEDQRGVRQLAYKPFEIKTLRLRS